MACIQYPRKERGGVSLGSWEQPTIYKEPPKEIFTRKKERIEEGDITYNIRNDPSRYNDSITNWQKGKNMMVAVDYQNRAPQTTTMNFGSASNPYKVNKSFRPPEFNLLDLQPLSRQKRPYVAGQTNIGSAITRNDHQEDRMDRNEIDFSIGAERRYHEEKTNLANEQGVYHDNFEYKDMINEDYVSKQVLSQLKGIESVELQKYFQYENTPNGIVLTPLLLSALSSKSGPISVEDQRHLSELLYAIQEITSQNVEANRSATTQLDYHLPEIASSIKEVLSIAQGTNQSGVTQVEAQRHISEILSSIKEKLSIGQGTNKSGGTMNVEEQRNVQEEVYIREDGSLYVGMGTNTKGTLSEQGMISYDNQVRDVAHLGLGTNVKGVLSEQGTISYDNLVRNVLQLGLGTNTKASSSFNGEHDQQEKLKEILLKNMTSTVSIVIQQSGSTDEYQIQGNIKDKIDIIVHSAKGQTITIDRSGGEPIRLKDYTWKFVKSANGSDKFILVSQQPELELERKSELYSVSSAHQGAAIQGQLDDITLRRQVRNTSAVTNVGIMENVERVDDSVYQRVEKETHYTNHQVQANPQGLQRESWSSIQPSSANQRLHIQRNIVAQSQGRFD
jgi:hypothetical protein